MIAKKSNGGNITNNKLLIELAVEFGKVTQMAVDTKEQLNKFITNDFQHLNEKVDGIDERLGKVIVRVAVIYSIGTALIIIANILSRIFIF